MLGSEGMEFIVVAGLSVGAFAAAVAAKSLALNDAVHLVRSRAQQMEKLYPVGYGMAAILGLDETNVTHLVESVFADSQPVFVANINSPRQIVISGAISAMAKVLRLALDRGAHKAELLPVATPSHCVLMKGVARSLRDQMKTIRVENPQAVYISNVNARAIRTGAGVAADLADNIAHGVRWYDTMIVAQELGCELFLETPPGHVLSDLVRENLLGVETCAFSSQSLERCLRLGSH
jgi:malonate decarboxylase epsilon subunit